MLILFPLDIRRKWQEYASYVYIDKRNIIHSKIQTQKIKLKEVSVSGSTKTYWKEIQNKEGNLLEQSSKYTLLSKANNNDIWKWLAILFAAIWN